MDVESGKWKVEGGAVPDLTILMYMAADAERHSDWLR